MYESPQMYGQAEQAKFVLNVLQNKRNGYYVEIGSNHPITINNTFVLEANYNWSGLLIEKENFKSLYEIYRKRSIPVIDDATTIDYKNLFEVNNVPFNIDYLQIDLEVSNGSTLATLQKLNTEVMDQYRFATITFEHDIYSSNYNNTRLASRSIFETRGYYRVFSDITNDGNPFEDWYVHPMLVDMNYITELQQKNQKHYTNCNVPSIQGLNWELIEY